MSDEKPIESVSRGGAPASAEPPATITLEDYVRSLGRQAGAAGFRAWAMAEGLRRLTPDEWREKKAAHGRRPVR